MTKVMNMNIRKIMFFQQFFKCCIYISGIHVFSVLACENRTPVNPSISDILLSMLLPFHLLCQCFHNLWRQ